MNQETETQTTATQTAAVAPKDIANGVIRPKLGSLTARVWEICDKLAIETSAPAERAKVIEQATLEGINAATAATQHGKWRKYHGLVADTPEAKAEKVAAVAKAKAEKKTAAKAEKKTAAKAAKVVTETAPPDDIVVEDDTE